MIKYARLLIVGVLVYSGIVHGVYFTEEEKKETAFSKGLFGNYYSMGPPSQSDATFRVPLDIDKQHLRDVLKMGWPGFNRAVRCFTGLNIRGIFIYSIQNSPPHPLVTVFKALADSRMPKDDDTKGLLKESVEKLVQKYGQQVITINDMLMDIQPHVARMIERDWEYNEIKTAIQQAGTKFSVDVNDIVSALLENVDTTNVIPPVGVDNPHETSVAEELPTEQVTPNVNNPHETPTASLLSLRQLIEQVKQDNESHNFFGGSNTRALAQAFCQEVPNSSDSMENHYDTIVRVAGVVAGADDRFHANDIIESSIAINRCNAFKNEVINANRPDAWLHVIFDVVYAGGNSFLQELARTYWVDELISIVSDNEQLRGRINTDRMRDIFNFARNHSALRQKLIDNCQVFGAAWDVCIQSSQHDLALLYDPNHPQHDTGSSGDQQSVTNNGISPAQVVLYCALFAGTVY